MAPTTPGCEEEKDFEPGQTSLRPWARSERRGARHPASRGARREASGSGRNTERGKPVAPPAVPHAAAPNPQSQDFWAGFKQRRHRMNPPPLFNEGELKFDKFGPLSYDETLIADGSDDGSVSPPLPTTPPAGSEEAIAVGDMGLRKARFFDKCLRADRSLEQPRPPVGAVIRGMRSKRNTPRIDRQGEKLPELPRAPLSARTVPWEALTRRRITVGHDLIKLDTGVATSSPTPRPPASPASDDGGGAFGCPARPLKTPNPLSASMDGLMRSCQLAMIHPSTTGIIRPDGESLKMEYGCMTDKRAQAVVQTLRASSSDVRHALFKSNGLTERGAQYLLNALPETVLTVDLSSNDLGHSDGWCTRFRKLTQLRELNLADSQIGDQVTKTLCMHVLRCGKLMVLNLSGNNILSATREVAAMVRNHDALENLDLHWNHISGDGAKDLCKSFYDNWQSGGSLRDVNLAWNPLGKVNGDEICRQLALVFAETKGLTHIDLTKCDLKMSQCQILADGLRDNRNILGVHINGNEAYMHQFGHMIPRPVRAEAKHTPQTVPSSPSLASASGGAGVASSDVMADGSRRSLDVLDSGETCCWICEKWRETRIVYTPGVSGPDVQDVWLFTSVDNFEQPLKLQKHGSDLVTFIMAPPGLLRFVFQAGSEIVTSRTAAMLNDFSPPNPRICKVPLLGEEGHDACGAGLDDASDVGIVVVCNVNCMSILERGADEVVCPELTPRRPGEFSVSQLEPQEWDLETSLFAPFDEALGRRTFCDKCFEMDLRVSCTGNFLKEDGDSLFVKELMRKYYADVKVLYSSLCSLDRGAPDGAPMAYGIGIYEYTHFLAQHNLIGEDMTVDSADAHFIIAATPPKDDHVCWHPVAQRGGRVLLRHGFVELLLRLALHMYARALLAPPGSRESKIRTKAKSMGHAFEILLNRNVMNPFPPTKNNFNCVQWRVDVLQQKVVEAVFRKHLKAVIDPLFAAYSLSSGDAGAHGTEGNAPSTPVAPARYVRPEDWFGLLDNLNILASTGEDEDSLMSTWDRVWIWQSSAMSRVDELTTAAHLRLSFVEFLEAIARLVGLLRARKRVVEASAEESERWEYGMERCSAATIFCIDKDNMDPDLFSVHLDRFLSSEAMLKAIQVGQHSRS